MKLFDLRESRDMWGTRLAPYLIYLLTAAVLLFLLLCGQKFWLTNDDIRMSMIVGGYGIAASPSAGLVIDNTVVWGWILEHVPDVAGIRGYTLATYLGFLASGVAIGFPLYRRGVPPLFRAACLLAMYASVILFPQFTLLSGYLAAGGFALVMVSERRRLGAYLSCAAVLLILAGLIRPDELALVFLPICPFLAYAWRSNADRRWRLGWLATAGACALVLGASFMFTLDYSSRGDWQGFHDIDSLRGEFTDYGLSGYFVAHPQKLADTPLTENDIKLVHAWFYLDDKVYNSATFGPLVASVSLQQRFHMNAGRYGAFLSVFKSPQILLLLGLFLLFAVMDWRRSYIEACSLAIMLALMIGISLWGRPGIERIYQPVAAAMMALALLKLGERSGKPVVALGVVALGAALYVSVSTYALSNVAEFHAKASRAATCAMVPTDRLVVIWSDGDEFLWKDIYRPTTPADDPCNPKLYSIGTYQLAPPSLAQFYSFTGGKNLVQALLAGQQFYIVTGVNRLKLLDTYLQRHYHRHLQWQQVADDDFYRAYTIESPP